MTFGLYAYFALFLHSLPADASDEIYPRGDFIPGKFRAANRADLRPEAFLVQVANRHDIHGDGLPSQRMAFSENPTFGHAFNLENDRLDFYGHEFFAPDIDYLPHQA